MIAPIIFCVLAVLVGAVSLWCRLAWLSAGAFISLILLLGMLWQSSLGQPRPMIVDTPHGAVVGFVFDEPHAIYLWVVPPNARIPVAYSIPWSETEAASLQRAAQDAKAAHESLEVGRGDGKPSDGAFKVPKSALRFYPAHHVPLPPKGAPA